VLLNPAVPRSMPIASFEKIRLPRISFPTCAPSSAPFTRAPAPPLCAITFSSPCPVPPTDALLPMIRIPSSPFPAGPPSASRPIAFPRTVVGGLEADVLSVIPEMAFPAMTLPSEEAAPPIAVSSAPTEMPSPLPAVVVPSARTPIKQPRMALGPLPSSSSNASKSNPTTESPLASRPPPLSTTSPFDDPALPPSISKTGLSPL